DFENLKNLQKALGLSESVTLLGYTENPYPFVKAADFYLLSSRYEGFPTVLSEAVALKKKIIATDVSGVSELLEDGKLGLIVENTEEGIYSGIKSALTKPQVFETYLENLKTHKI